MEMVIRHFEGCPNLREAEERIVAALAGKAAPITHEIVATHEEAIHLRFKGSPTILIDGVDPFDDPEAPVGLSCRLYATPQGFEAAPSVEQLKQAIAKSGG